MSDAFYNKLAATAAKLITKFGAVGTITRTTGGSINPVTGNTTAGTTVTYSPNTIVQRYADELVDGTRIFLQNFTWGNDEIPTLVKKCQMSLALDINAGEDLYNLSASESVAVKRERVEGAVEVEYAVTDSARIARNSRSSSLLAALMKNGGTSIPISMA